MTEEEIRELLEAKRVLEQPGLAAKIAGLLGSPIERGFELLPPKWSHAVGEITRKSLQAALHAALKTLNARGPQATRDLWHKVAVTATGATGGALGLPALTLELPVSTAIMLRSIADIARSEGEDLATLEARLACLEVFAFGSRSRTDDAAESGYFVVRTALARTVSETARYVAENGLAKEGAPIMVRLVAQIAERFGVVVSEKAAAQAIPAVGAIGGGLVNLMFIDHFQNIARAHFTIRRLERTCGSAAVKDAYARSHP